jgi:hypothetical protein
MNEISFDFFKSLKWPHFMFNENLILKHQLPQLTELVCYSDSKPCEGIRP